MKPTRIAFLGALMAGALQIAATAQMPAPAALVQSALYPAIGVAVGVGGPVGVDLFYHDLAPHGYWAQRANYGWVWTPRGVAANWRPYTAGRWVYTDYGWTWLSDESFGWATYHYGRWYEDPDYGWSWVPGTEWGPSWVSWQQGGGYLGWAPLPPAVGWGAAGLALGGFNLSVGLSPASYCFVPERSFLYGHVGGYVVPYGRNAELFRESRNITNYGVVNGRVFNRSLDVRHIQEVTGRPVHEYRVGSLNGNARMGAIHGNEVAMFHPRVERRAGGPEPPQIAPRSVASGRVAQDLAARHHEMLRTAAVGGAVVGAGVAAHVAQQHRAEQARIASAHREGVGAEHQRHEVAGGAAAAHHERVAGAQSAAHARAQHNQAVAVHHEAVAHGQVHAQGVQQHGGVQHREVGHPQAATVHHASPPPHQAGAGAHPAAQAQSRHAGPPQGGARPQQHAGGEHKPPHAG